MLHDIAASKNWSALPITPATHDPERLKGLGKNAHAPGENIFWMNSLAIRRR